MEQLVYKEYILKCLSPVHVGDGNTLKSFEYLYDAEQQIVYFIDEAKWIDFLNRHQLIDAFALYLKQISEALSRKDNYDGEYVWEWLLRQGIAAEELRQLAVHQARAEANAMLADRQTLNDIVCQATEGNGRPYIPGSTLKGALRTAILYALMKQNPELCDKYAEQLINERNDKNNNKKIKRADNDLEGKLLVKLRPNRKARWKPNAQLLNVMRGLSVSDAHCVQEDQKTVIVRKIDAVMDADGHNVTDKALPIVRECLPAGAELKFSITIQPAMLKEVGIESIDQILACAREYLQSGLDLQEQVFGQAHSKELAEARTADILIGGGTGFISKTLAYPLFRDFAAGKAFVQTILQNNFRKHKHDALDTSLAPRTLKLTNNGMGYSLMGLCQLNEVQR